MGKREDNNSIPQCINGASSDDHDNLLSPAGVRSHKLSEKRQEEERNLWICDCNGKAITVRRPVMGAAKQLLVLDCKREYWLAGKRVPMPELKDYGGVTMACRIKELMWIVGPLH